MKKSIILIVFGVLLICFSGAIGRGISWNKNIDKSTCYSMNSGECAKNIDDLAESGFDATVAKYYNGVQTSAGIFRSLGIVISTVFLVKAFNNLEKDNKKKKK